MEARRKREEEEARRRREEEEARRKEEEEKERLRQVRGALTYIADHMWVGWGVGVGMGGVQRVLP